MDTITQLQQNRRIIHDFTSATLASLPGSFARLAYIASLRDLSSNTYEHPGLAAVYRPEAVQQALEQCHEEIFERILETPLAMQEEELRAYLKTMPAGMPSVSRFAQRHRVPIAVLLLCLCAAGFALAQQSAAPAPPASSGKASASDFAAAADEVLAQMSEITHLQPRAPLKKTLRSREEIRAHVIQEMNEDKDPAERYAGARSAEAFGLLPKGFDLDSFMIDLLTEQVAGLYDPKAHEFYVADWIPITDQRRVMAHELTHALEDQHFEIESWGKAPRPNDTSELPRQAVLEGSAMAAMAEYRR